MNKDFSIRFLYCLKNKDEEFQQKLLAGHQQILDLNNQSQYLNNILRKKYQGDKQLLL